VKRPPSLALRLVLYILAAQIIGAVITALSIELLRANGTLHGSTADWNDLAERRTTDLVIQSLRPQNGDVVIEPNAALRAEMQRAPKLQVAVFHAKSNMPAPGSSPQLVERLASLGKIRMLHTVFTFVADGEAGERGHIWETHTPFGRLRIASYGHRFYWSDVFYVMHNSVTGYLQYFIIDIFVVSGIGWLALKRGLEPLNQVARETERIDIESLDQRLPLASVPAEVMKIVAAMNRALVRLDEGAERQRRFLANAAHELRTPVAILTERLDGPDQPGLKKEIQRDAGRIRNVVEQLLATARIDRRGGDVQETVDLVEIVQSMIDDHALLAVRTQRNLALGGDEGPIFVRGQRRALESVLANLIDNALRAEPEGGTVFVQVGPNADVAVIDHGEGVAPADRTKIFEPFWRKSEATAGTGLGLAIAKELVEKLGGRIWVEDTPGGGATFKLWFPAAASETHANLNDAHSASRTNA
jgi:signal transduction histidine kinase